MTHDADDLESQKNATAPAPSAPEKSENAEISSPTDPSSETDKSRDFEETMKTREEAGEDTEELRRQYLLTRFWQTASAFWGKRGRRIAWSLSGALLLILLLNLAASFGMNLWNRTIFDALEKKDSNTVLLLSMIYFAILMASVGLGEENRERRAAWRRDNPELFSYER